MRHTYTGPITELAANQVFVFGSNTQGRHGKGAALTAMKFGARYGQPRGRQGQTYAIVTKDLRAPKGLRYNSDLILAAIEELYYYADNHKDLDFMVAYSGTGVNLNGYTPDEMAQMFAETTNYGDIFIPENIIFEATFWTLIQKYYTE